MDIPAIIGESTLLDLALERLSLVAPLHKPVLIIGERGTGKELMAQRLHYLSERWDQAFIKLNCAALSESLLESALFGHEVGAFTGANKQVKGCFERAHEGTLFLDELATASLRVQEKLLRAIEYGEIERLGGQETLQVNVRVVAATNADLPALADKGEFRADLLDRLAFDVLHLPPLRLREGDALLLAESFAMAMCRELDRPVFAGFSVAAKKQLQGYKWPGNIRELKNAVERSVYRHQDYEQPLPEIVTDPFSSPWSEFESEAKSEPVSIPVSDSVGSAGSGLAGASEPEEAVGDIKAQVAEFEQRLISRALRFNHFQQKHTAESLGLTYHQLRAYLRKYPQLLSDR
ncbi:phage shock protein operon transcriptional activator [Aliamphritea spongicola]|uniref:phage shock protein operon transcriptional activator n=1 Tax=Aliamphritea spongicola TaxID=707589 RepID=UPI00196AE2BB|nr:phage shock protein operon transcriptional activator [Aliamphritea spongicola]MBN3562459.1 phage shock protein operon transcriptional activator [Aliamphritea spongicola]